MAVWILMAAVGVYAMARYEVTPGESALAHRPLFLSGKTGAQLKTNGLPQIVFFAHPQCSCARAGLEQLRGIADEAPGRAGITVVIGQPSATPESRAASFWRNTGEIAGLRLLADSDGGIAREFGTRTSGETLLFDSAGREIFEGGITPVRGRAGNNPGSRQILDFLLRGTLPTVRTPVFGCALEKIPSGTWQSAR